MVTIHKKTLSILLIVGIGLPTQAMADGNAMFRKGLGLVGVGIIVNGLWKIIRQRHCHGAIRVISGAVIALGGICSDIILDKVASIMRKQKIDQQRQQQPRQGILGHLQDKAEDVCGGAQEYHEGVLTTVGNAVRSEVQMEAGKKSLQSGNLITGLDQICDAFYHGIRGRCRMVLHQKYWRNQ